MKRYVGIAKLVFKSQLAWRFDIFFNMLYTILRLLFAAIVWGIIFREQEVVAGFTLQSMLTYYAATSFLSQLESTHGSTDELSGSIRDGSFTKIMVVPVSAEGYYFATSAAAKLFHGAFLLVAAAGATLALRIPFSITGRPAVIISAVLLEIMGLIFSMQLNFFIGILAFKLENTWLLHMIKSNLIAFVTGVIVPLTLLPPAVLAALRPLPFYYTTYMPSMLLIGRETEHIRAGFVILSLWIAAFLFINRACYQHLRKKHEGVGI